MIHGSVQLIAGLLSSFIILAAPAYASPVTPVLPLQSATPPTTAPRNRALMRGDFTFCVTRPAALPTTLTSMINACERALADPPEANQVALERQSLLLHSKAVWQFCSGDMAGALATLDRADTLGAGERSLILDGSTGLANMMLRALVYGETGRQEEALTLLQQARAVRPYALAIQSAIDRIDLRITEDVDRIPMLTQRHLVTDPAAATRLFYQHAVDGDFVSAVATADMASFGTPRLIGGWHVTGPVQVDNGVKGGDAELSREIDFLHHAAYAWAAQGNDPRVEGMFASVEQRLARYTGPEPVAGPTRRTVPQRAMEEWQHRSRIADRIRRGAEPWRAAISLRAALAAGGSPELIDDPRYTAVRTLPITADLLGVIVGHHPQYRPEMEAILSRIRSERIASLALSRFEATDLLPESEPLANYPRFGRAGDGIVIGRETGYSQAPERDGDIRTIRFGTQTGSAATADELVILAAATYAQREGMDSFLIVGRHLLERTTRITSWYGLRTNEVDSGSEGSVLAVLIDSNAIPPQWEPHRSRLIRVADIMASVGARQQAIEAAKIAESRRR